MSSAARRADPAEHTVSVYIAAYNGAAYIAEAIESSLGHDYPPLEVIVTDDASTDRTAEVATSYPGVRLIRHEANRGQAAARNTAIAAARGEFVAALDQDDRHLPGRLRAQVEAVLSRPGAEASAGPARHFSESGERAPERAPEWSAGAEGDLAGLASRRARSQPIFSTILFRRAALGERPYDESAGVGDDLDLGLRFLERDQMVLLERELIERRIHDANLGRDHARVMRGIAMAMKRRAERLRAERSSTAPGPPLGGAGA